LLLFLLLHAHTHTLFKTDKYILVLARVDEVATTAVVVVVAVAVFFIVFISIIVVVAAGVVVVVVAAEVVVPLRVVLFKTT